ncbi:hypothetical protein BDB00DRAFT_857660 [Zychaea mexicana]|uniref:uncharacterized protein n=1 Tax=Zychaea mexicana TaxID=64656 RepID=UPI0022FF0730|nr:uncharacterized protein BDB00DRAFT_857660 [Zychaea mexicana]KAI9482517.1 hypothetical protein BDB00DRAFT_857660 [Zychaea mexicana]
MPKSDDKHALDREVTTMYQHTFLNQPRSHSRRTASTGAVTDTAPQHCCFNCNQPCVRSDRSPIQALGRIYHYQCFVCEDCQMPVTDKYYALDHDTIPRSIVCERHYYTRLNNICRQCGEPLQEDAPLEMIDGHKYHQQCIRCPGCFLAIQAQQQHQLKRSSRIMRSSRNSTSSSDYYVDDSKEKFVYGARSYCRYHFSLLRGTACVGCGQAVLCQPVHDRDNPERWWHHECFMIQKYWNVKLADERKDHHGIFLMMSPDELMKSQATIEHKRRFVYSELKGFEDALAASISDMAVDITAGAYRESIQMANQLAWHLRVLFSAHQKIHALYEEHKPPPPLPPSHHSQLHHPHQKHQEQVYECDKWSRIIGAQVLQLFDLVDAKSGHRPSNNGYHQREDFTKDVVRFVTLLASNLKECLRVGIIETLKMEHEYGVKDAILTFLEEFVTLKKSRTSISGRYYLKDAPFPIAATGNIKNNSSMNGDEPNRIIAQQDQCHQCQMVIEDACWQFQHARWHTQCLICSSCKQSIDPPFNARIGVHQHQHQRQQQQQQQSSIITADTKQQHAESNLILLCDRCTIDPRKRRNYTMQQAPLSRVTQLEQCMHLLRVAVARVHQRPIGKKGLPANNNNSSSQKLQLHQHHHQLQQKQQQQQQQEQHVNKEYQHPPMIGKQPPSSSPSPARRMTLDSSPAVARFQHQEPVATAAAAAATAALGPLFVRNNNAVKRSKSAQADFDIASSLPRRVATISNQQQLSPSSYHHRDDHHTTTTTTTAATTLDNNKMFSTVSSLSGKKLGTTLRRALSTGRPQQQQSPRLQTIFGNGNNAANNNDKEYSNSPTTPLPTAPATEPGGPYWLAELTTIQDSIIRSLAALYIERHVSLYFEFEELLSLLECKKESLWGKVKMHFRNSSSRQPSPSSSIDTSNGKVFGAPLMAVLSREKVPHPHHYDHRTRAAAISYVMTHHPTMAACFSENAMVPSVVQNIILALLHQDLTIEGIFRKNGNIRELKETCDMVDKGHDYTQLLYHDSSAIQLAALLKRFVRDLPEPLLTFKLHKLFLTSLQMPTEAEAKTVLYFACCMLPKPNRDVMQLLFLFLNHVASLHEHNKMDIHNIARIFSPSVLYASPVQQQQQQQQPQHNTRDEIEVVQMLIKYQPDFTMVRAERHSSLLLLASLEKGGQEILTLYHVDLLRCHKNLPY